MFLLTDHMVCCQICWDLGPDKPSTTVPKLLLRPRTPQKVTITLTAPHTANDCSHAGACQNYGPFLGTLNIRRRSIMGNQEGTIVLTTTHVQKLRQRSSPSLVLHSLEVRNLIAHVFVFCLSPPTPYRTPFRMAGVELSYSYHSKVFATSQAA